MGKEGETNIESLEVNEAVKETNEVVKLREPLRSLQRQILKRKLELITRDPLGIKLASTINKIQLPIVDYPDDVQKMLSELEQKWKVILSFTRDQMYRFKQAGWPYDDPIDPKGEKHFVIDAGLIREDYHRASRRIMAVNFYRLDASKGRKRGLGFLMDLYEQDRLATDDKLFFEVDLNLIDLQDRKMIKKDIQRVIEHYLKKRQSEGRRRILMDESIDVVETLIQLRETTFQNYLRWYDVHTQENLSFRLIAVIENIRKENNIPGAERLLEELIHKKIKWGQPVKGEDRIEKGVKFIFTAIHRKTYLHKENEPAIIEQYNCPTHGNKCQTSCKYHKEWIGRFNRLNKIS